MVPVSVRRRGEMGVYNNRVSAVFAGLPVGLGDPAQRLARIRAEMDGVNSPSRRSPPPSAPGREGCQRVGSETVRPLTSMLKTPLLAR
jgi:hypothetical protein